MATVFPGLVEVSVMLTVKLKIFMKKITAVDAVYIIGTSPRSTIPRTTNPRTIIPQTTQPRMDRT
jgi:hypothetical protein